MQSSKTGGERLRGVHYSRALGITGDDARSDPKADTLLGLENPNIYLSYFSLQQESNSGE